MEWHGKLINKIWNTYENNDTTVLSPPHYYKTEASAQIGICVDHVPPMVTTILPLPMTPSIWPTPGACNNSHNKYSNLQLLHELMHALFNGKNSNSIWMCIKSV